MTYYYILVVASLFAYLVAAQLHDRGEKARGARRALMKNKQ